MRNRVPKILLLAVMALVAACDDVDCPLYNVVSLRCGFYAEGRAVAVNDTLSVTASGTDSVLINRDVMARGMELPMSAWREADTLIVSVWGADYAARDTLMVRKENLTHFDGPDCPAKVFHHITNIAHTRNFLDSVTISHADVNYAQIENLQLHIRAALP